MSISSIACWEKTIESIDIAVSTEKSADVEKLENIQVSIQEGLLQGENALYIDK